MHNSCADNDCDIKSIVSIEMRKNNGFPEKRIDKSNIYLP